MQVQMHRVDSINMVDRMFAPSDDTGFREYIRERSERTARLLEKAGSRIRDGFRERAAKIFEAANSASALRKTREAIRSLTGVKRASMVYPVESVEDLRGAGWMMQRWLLADPVIRKSYLRQTIDGYSETYVNQHGKAIGEDHYDYRRVIDGMYRFEVDADGEEVIVHDQFYEELIEGDRDLDAEEQFDIMAAWRLQRMCAEMNIDSTNRRGGTLS